MLAARIWQLDLWKMEKRTKNTSKSIVIDLSITLKERKLLRKGQEAMFISIVISMQGKVCPQTVLLTFLPIHNTPLPHAAPPLDPFITSTIFSCRTTSSLISRRVGSVLRYFFITTRCCERRPQRGIKKPRNDSQVSMQKCRWRKYQKIGNM